MEQENKDVLNKIHSNPAYSFTGNLDWEMLKKIIIEVEDFTKTVSDNRIFQQKVFHALVEMLQNSYRYQNANAPVTVSVKVDNKKLYVLSKNGLLADEMKNLNYLIEIINSLNYDELKAIQMEQLQTGKIEPQFKKYNGMMSIRRRTNNKLICSFSKDEEHGFMVEIISTIDVE